MTAFIRRQPKAVRYTVLALVAIAVPGGIAIAMAIHHATKNRAGA